ncbi:MAG: hypothetical protein RQ715_02970 [Methylococcales bacterium]|nr:hypothetical protein [Methylococcales bacterium]
MVNKSSDDLSDDIDYDDDDQDATDNGSLGSDDRLSADHKIDARRKIELYWEKRRLREELGDVEDWELDF